MCDLYVIYTTCTPTVVLFCLICDFCALYTCMYQCLQKQNLALRTLALRWEERDLLGKMPTLSGSLHNHNCRPFRITSDIFKTLCRSFPAFSVYSILHSIYPLHPPHLLYSIDPISLNFPPVHLTFENQDLQ